MRSIDFNMLNFKNLFIIGFLFLLIYTPLVLLPFNILHVLTIISLFFLVTKYPAVSIEIIRYPELRVFIALHIILIADTLIINSLASGDFSTTYHAFSTIVEVLPCCIYISILLLEQEIDLSKFYNIILTVGMLQVAWVILAIIFPGLREWIIASSGSQGLEEVYDKVGLFRIFGLARGYTFTMPLFQGLCVIIAFVLGAYKSSKYFIFIPFYLVSIALNARIAFLSLLIAPIAIFFFQFKKHPIKQIVTGFFLLLVLLFAVQLTQYMAENSSSFNAWNWLNAGIEEVQGLEDGESKGNIGVLSEMWVMPKGISFLIGTGENVFGSAYESSDIGYVINLYYGGVLFSALLYLAYFLLLMKYSRDNSIEETIAISLIAYLFIANIKGNVFAPNEIINGALIMIVFSIVSRKIPDIGLSTAPSAILPPLAN